MAHINVWRWVLGVLLYSILAVAQDDGEVKSIPVSPSES